mmetsp:Transcript_46880/g.34318  ORF Transcript_46880/g.34318 Transcript_46880/m.34318 type:complete len:110 (+) Transcript_46880:759-1088(+)
MQLIHAVIEDVEWLLRFVVEVDVGGEVFREEGYDEDEFEGLEAGVLYRELLCQHVEEALSIQHPLLEERTHHVQHMHIHTLGTLILILRQERSSIGVADVVGECLAGGS